jgi:hypothetical protein
MSRPILVPALAMAFMLGCGSGAVQLTREEYARLPREYRLELFDAENDVVIARNHEEEAEDRKAAAEQTLTDLAQRWKRTNQRLSSSGQAAKLPRARHVYDTNVAYVASQVDVASAAIRRAQAETRLRRAHLELVSQRQAARIGRATVGSIKPFEATVAALENKLKAATTAEVDLRTKVQTHLNAWKVAQDEFAAAASDFDTGVWEE